uniref:Uncharacterized protein n=1 Tax=Megaselia scalaris TaxID=36166 RepID=T1GH98_MEGSC
MFFPGISFRRALKSTVKKVHYDWISLKIDKLNKYHKQFLDYRFIEGKLFRHIYDKKQLEESWKMCISKDNRSRVLKECRITKTIEHLLKYYYCPRNV